MTKTEMIRFLTLPGEKVSDVMREFKALPEKDQADLLRWAEAETTTFPAAA